MHKAALFFVLTGCAATPPAAGPAPAALLSVQAACAPTNPRVSQLASCMEDAINRLPTLTDKWWARSYVASAKSLGTQVDSKRISDADARARLGDLYVYLVNRDRLTREAEAARRRTDEDRQNAEAKRSWDAYMDQLRQSAQPKGFTCYTVSNFTHCDPS